MSDDLLRESTAYVLFFELARRERLAVVTAQEAGLDSVALRELAIRDYAAGRRNPFRAPSEDKTVTRLAAAILATLADGGEGEIPTDIAISGCLEAAIRLVKSAGDDFSSIDAIDTLQATLASARRRALSRN